MRFSRVVPLLPLASALVITDADVFQNIEKSGRSIIGNAQNVLDGAFGKVDDAFEKVKDDAKEVFSKIYETGCDVESWLEGSYEDVAEDLEEDHPGPLSHDGPPRDGPPHGGPPHRGPPPHGPPEDGPPKDGPPHDGHPKDGPPHHGPPPHGPPKDGPPRGGPPHRGPPPHGPPKDGPPHHGPPKDGPPHHGPPRHGKPHHPPHHHEPNQTIYELISKSKYTTKLAKLIDEYDDLVKLLNGTKANYTVFAPTDAAFEKIPEHHKKPSKEFLEDLLMYHVSDDFYPAGRVLHSYTIPTLYKPKKTLGGAQRLTVRMSLRGPTINFYSRLVAANIFATNGVIHGVDSILVPPPNVASIINLLPGEFSTLELGLSKTGIDLNSTKYPHRGGTIFAPSNFAFKKLGTRANAFLFSKYGEKYLRALLEYHMVVNQTLYTDAFYDNAKDSEVTDGRPPYYHYDLPTVLEGKSLAVDISRYGPFVSVRINGFSRVTVHDGVASDGVIQVVSDVLIPPKNAASEEQIFWQGEELEIEDLKERLEPYVEESIEL